MKRDRVKDVLAALNTIQQTVPHLTDEEREELVRHLSAIAGAFESSAPEDVRVPFVKDISLGLSDVAGMVRDAYGLAQD